MTLYHWMHWFWITLCFISIIQSQPTLMSSTGTLSHYVFNKSSIPPTTISPDSHSTEKPYKFTPKKHLIKNITATTTVIAPQLTVIEQNFTTSSMENESLNITTAAATTIAANQSDFENNTIPELDYTDERNATQNNLSAAGITGITVGCIGIVGIICGVSFVIYRNRGLNRPQVLNDRCSNPDSSGYIDDASIRDNSEEMYSLDNDSFLNSLEAMTIQNYWTDTVKHTKL